MKTMLFHVSFINIKVLRFSDRFTCLENHLLTILLYKDLELDEQRDCLDQPWMLERCLRDSKDACGDCTHRSNSSLKVINTSTGEFGVTVVHCTQVNGDCKSDL